MSEKNILAYFHSPEQAEGVAAKLKALRANTVQVDRFSRYPGSGMDYASNPVIGNFTSLASLTQGADIYSPDSGVLLAADPSASGLSDGGGGVTGRDILLTAVVDESVYDQSVRVIEQAGGMI